MNNKIKWQKSYDKGVSFEVKVSENETLDSMVRGACQRFNDKVAFYNLGKEITFCELDKKINALASYFQNILGLQKGDRIAIQLPNILQTPIAIFAAIRAGLIVVNTNPLYTSKEMQHQFKDSGAKAVIILENFVSKLEEIINDTQIQHVISTKVGDLLGFPKGEIVDFVLKHVKKAVPDYRLRTTTFKKALTVGSKYSVKSVDLKSDDLAFLQYTGGTTGVAKGAMLTHKNILINVKQVDAWFGEEPITDQDFICSPLPLYHIFSLTCNLMTFINLGCSNLLITNPRDINAVIKDLKKYPITVITGVNTLYNAILQHKDFEKVNWKRYRAIVAGGTALQKSVADEFTDRTGMKITEGYGLTEASPLVSCNPLGATGVGNQIGTIGIPLPSTEVCFFDEDGEVVKGVTPGELAVRGPQVMKGYWNRPEETKRVMKGDWLLTGDVAFMDEDGFIKIVDRKKDLILVSGFNVYPNEIEDAISTHPGVHECAVIGVKDDKCGERPIAVIVMREGFQLASKELKEFCKKNLTSYKIPKSFMFYPELPKSNVGKILRRVVRDEVSRLEANA